MASFAERIGRREVRSIFQTDELDKDTRVELWNVANSVRSELNSWQTLSESLHNEVVTAIWQWEFKKPADEKPYRDDDLWMMIKQFILDEPWFDALDLIERLVQYIDRYESEWIEWSNQPSIAASLADEYNKRFELYLVGYRFINLEITPIDSSQQSQAVSEAIEDAQTVRGARHHLSRAVELLADRQNPDYPNSIKESISAVEAVCVAITGKKTLGQALKKLEDAGLRIHPVLKEGWLKLYGWSSDDDGIRHGGIEAPDADQPLAKYMLVTCSSFVSHLIELGRKTELI